MILSRAEPGEVAVDEACNGDKVTDHYYVLLVKLVREFSAEEGYGQADNAIEDHAGGNVSCVQAQLLVQDQGEHGPDHGSHVGHDSSDEKYIQFFSQPFILAEYPELHAVKYTSN